MLECASLPLDLVAELGAGALHILFAGRVWATWGGVQFSPLMLLQKALHLLLGVKALAGLIVLFLLFIINLYLHPLPLGLVDFTIMLLETRLLNHFDSMIRFRLLRRRCRLLETACRLLAFLLFLLGHGANALCDRYQVTLQTLIYPGAPLRTLLLLDLGQLLL